MKSLGRALLHWVYTSIEIMYIICLVDKKNLVSSTNESFHYILKFKIKYFVITKILILKN